MCIVGPMIQFRSVVAALAMLLALSFTATDVKSSATPTFRYSYTGFLQEAPMLTLQLDVTATGSTAYRMSVSGDLISLMNNMYPFHLQATSEGRFSGRASLPSRYRSEIAVQDGNQTVTLIYGQGGAVQMIDRPGTEEGQEAFRRGLVAGTIDPLSAVAAVARNTAGGRDCGGRVQVFDGARRYDVSFSPVPRSVPPPASLPAGFTSAVAGCDALLTLLSGFPQADIDSGAYPRTVRFWLAADPKSKWGVLLRADADSGYGHVHLQYVGVQTLP
jgi:hypothetical protein